MESTYTSLVSLTERHEFLERWDQLIDDALRIAHAAGDDAAAFDFAVRLQGRLLYEESLAGDHETAFRAEAYLSADDRDRWAEVGARLQTLAFVTDARLRALQKAQALSESAARLALRREPDRAAQEEEEDALRSERSQLLGRALHARGRAELPPPTSGAAVCATVRERGATFVLTSWTPDVACAAVTHDGKLLRVDLSAGRLAIEDGMASLESLSLPRQGVAFQPGRNAWGEALTTLRSTLWMPVVASLPKDRPVYLTPAGSVRINGREIPLALAPFWAWAVEDDIDLRIIPTPGILTADIPVPESPVDAPLFAISANVAGDLRGTDVERSAIRALFPEISPAHLRGTGDNPWDALLFTEGSFSVLFISSHIAPDQRPHVGGIVLASRPAPIFCRAR